MHHGLYENTMKKPTRQITTVYVYIQSVKKGEEAHTHKKEIGGNVSWKHLAADQGYHAYAGQ